MYTLAVSKVGQCLLLCVALKLLCIQDLANMFLHQGEVQLAELGNRIYYVLKTLLSNSQKVNCVDNTQIVTTLRQSMQLGHCCGCASILAVSS